MIAYGKDGWVGNGGNGGKGGLGGLPGAALIIGLQKPPEYTVHNKTGTEMLKEKSEISAYQYLYEGVIRRFSNGRTRLFFWHPSEPLKIKLSNAHGHLTP